MVDLRINETRQIPIYRDPHRGKDPPLTVGIGVGIPLSQGESVYLFLRIHYSSLVH